MKTTLLLTVLLLAGCGESPTPILDCVAADGITPDCRFQNPEDLAQTPSGRALIVSQFGSMDGLRPGSIARYRLDDGDIEVLFPPAEIEDVRSWGDANCPPPDSVAFAPHGIDLDVRSDGRNVLLVVNHGARESVEFLEVFDAGADVRLEWRGCVEGPAKSYFNDIVSRSDGGFWATHMMPMDAQTRTMLQSVVFGTDTGWVYAWNPRTGFTRVPGSDGPFPNGIEKSADERHLFINMYLGGEVRKLDLARGEVVARAKVANPDNSTWSPDGQLLVATHTDGFLEQMSCQSLEAGSCGFAFEIVRVDPSDMSGSLVLSHRGAPFGAATVALQVGDELFLGTFAGDRIARYALH